MKYSDRAKDVKTNKRVEHVMDSIYGALGWSVWRPRISEWDKRGIDVVLQIPGCPSKLWVDEKAATKYWDRNLETFSCELTCNSTKNGYGWFAKENNGYMANTHLLFVWLHALEEDLIHISSLRFLVVNKHDLQKYFELSVGMKTEDDTREFLEHSVQWNERGRFEVNEDLALKKCRICPEYPVNAIFSRRILEQLAIDGAELTRFQVRDALNRARTIEWKKSHK